MSTSISRVLDPVIDQINNRVEFVLPNNTILSSDIRVLNIGAIVADNDRSYNRMAGGMSLIKNIYLQSNGVTLDQILDANTWIAFKQQLKSHGQAESLERNLVGNAQGLIVNSSSVLDTTYTPKPLSTSLAASGKTMISLTDVLPLLRSTRMLPTTIFTDLRLVIEYETDIVKIGTTSLDTLTTMLTPFVVVDEMLDTDFIKSQTNAYQGVGFMSIERDMVFSPTSLASVSGVAGNVTNSHSMQLRGYDNKFISRVLFVPKAMNANAYVGGADGLVAGGGGLGAVALLKPSYNVVVNGSNKIAGAGLIGYSEIQGRTIDTWGEMNCPTQANTPGVFDEQTIYAKAAEYVGYAGYMGLTVNDSIQSLYLNLDYTAQYDAGREDEAHKRYATLNTQYQIMSFAECRKSIIVRPDKSFIVSYN